MNRLLWLCVVGIVGLSACKEHAPEPPWLMEKIDQIQQEQVSNPPTVLYRFRYRQQTVYYRPAHCCDVQSVVYATDGAVICHPGGGFTGNGDGRCSDFLSSRTDCELVWADPRGKVPADGCAALAQQKPANLGTSDY